MHCNPSGLPYNLDYDPQSAVAPSWWSGLILVLILNRKSQGSSLTWGFFAPSSLFWQPTWCLLKFNTMEQVCLLTTTICTPMLSSPGFNFGNTSSIPSPTKSHTANSTVTTCALDCTNIGALGVYTYLWLPATTGVAFATRVDLLDPIGTASTSTMIFVPDGYFPTPAPTNQAGTNIATVQRGDGSGAYITATIAYPTMYQDYPAANVWKGTLPVTTSGTSACLTNSAEYKVSTSHSPLPSAGVGPVDPHDPKGLNYALYVAFYTDFPLYTRALPDYAPLSCVQDPAPFETMNPIPALGAEMITTTSFLSESKFNGPIAPPPSDNARLVQSSAPPAAPGSIVQPQMPAVSAAAPLPGPIRLPAPATNNPSPPTSAPAPPNVNPLPPPAAVPANEPEPPANQNPAPSINNPAPQVNNQPPPPAAANPAAAINNPAPPNTNPQAQGAAPAAPQGDISAPQVANPQLPNPAAPIPAVNAGPPANPAPPQNVNSGGSGSNNGAPIAAPLPSQAPAVNAPQPTALAAGPIAANPAPVLSALGTTFTANVAPQFIGNGVTLQAGAPAQIANTPVSIAANGRAAVIDGSTQQLAPGAALTVAGSVFTPAPAAPVFNIGGQSIAAGGPALTISGNVISIAPAGTAAVVNGITQNLVPAPAAPQVLTLGSQTITANSKGAFVVSGQTLSAGGSAVNVGGIPISIGSGFAVVGGRTQALARAAPTNAPGGAPLVVGGVTVTPNARGQYVVEGQTLNIGGPAMTIHGTPVSLGSNFAVVGSSTQFLNPTQRTAAPLILGDTTITPNAQGQYIIAGQTLTAGSPAITVSGTRISLGQGYAVIGSSTEFLTSNAVMTAAPLVIGSQTITPNAQGQYIIDGQTLTNGEVTIISGTRVSMAAGGESAIVGTSTEMLQASVALAGSPITIAPGEVFTMNAAGSYVFNGQTLTPGGSAVTVDGATISLGASGRYVVVNGRTTYLSGVSATATASATSTPPASGSAPASGSGTDNSGSSTVAAINAASTGAAISSIVIRPFLVVVVAMALSIYLR
ncbi:MAG: hypothetical protein Q9162_003077 [Coniocarpon cinnabarinum]